jgi:hypothetical protein
MSRVLFEYAELVRRAIEARVSNIHTAIPGKVVSYDDQAQTADIEPQLRYNGEVLPVVQKVRVGWPRGGDGYIVFPMAAGDFGLLICCERDITAWVTSGEAQDPGYVGKHALGSAVFYPGIYPNGHDLAVTSGSTVLGGGTVEVDADSVLLGSAAAADGVLKGTAWKSALDTWLIDVGTWVAQVQPAIVLAGGSTTAGADYIASCTTLVNAFQSALSTKVKVE